ncbi:MAG: glycosyltransferase family 2 protein [Pseudomonadota bacterium]
MAAKHAQDRAGTCRLIITSMKNEGPYILEWIAHHRAIGFTDFLVYTNDCEDGTVEILERLQTLGIVTHQPNEILLRGPQKSALKWAKEQEITKGADWILVSDIDEFLNIKIGDGTVQELINHLPDADVIPVTWRLFSHDGVVPFVDAPLMAQFTDAERALDQGGFPMRYVKSIFRRQEDLKRFGTHGPIPEDGREDSFTWIAPDGRVLGKNDSMTRPQSVYGYEIAQFNHYAVRSVDSYLIKRDRGRVNHYRQVMGVDYWQKMCRGGEVDTSIQRHIPAMTAEVARLREDAELAALHDASVEWHHAKIADLEAVPEFAAMKADILRLSEAGDHHRTLAQATRRKAAEPPKSLQTAAPPAPTQLDPLGRINELCRELRGLIDGVSPVDAAIEAHGRLDEIEKGLFGTTSR